MPLTSSPICRHEQSVNSFKGMQDNSGSFPILFPVWKTWPAVALLLWVIWWQFHRKKFDSKSVSGFNAKLIIRGKNLPTSMGCSAISNRGLFCRTVTERTGWEWPDPSSCDFKEAKKRVLNRQAGWKYSASSWHPDYSKTDPITSK